MACSWHRYEGLIDEMVGIVNAYIEVDPATVGHEGVAAGRKVSTTLTPAARSALCLDRY